MPRDGTGHEAASPREVRYLTSSPTALPSAEVAKNSSAGTIPGRGRYYPPAEGSRLAGGVIICPGLGGPTDVREFLYAQRFASQGYATLVINPYTARRAAWLSDPLRPLLVGPAMVLADAFAALRWLRDEIGAGVPVSVFGFSYGGMISLLAAHEQIARGFAPDGERFSGHAAYCGCSVPRLEDPAATGAPVLMLSAEQDRNVSLPRVGLIAEDLRRGGAEVDLRVLPGAWHAWDGWDERRRWVPFSLRDCEVMVGRDGVWRDERSGRVIQNHRSLVLFLARRARIAGYHMQRDHALAQATDALLFSFLERMGANTPLGVA